MFLFMNYIYQLCNTLIVTAWSRFICSHHYLLNCIYLYITLHEAELHPPEWSYGLSGLEVHKSASLFIKSKLLSLTALLTGNSEAGLSLLGTGRMHVKDAGVAALVTEAHPADGDGRGVFWGGGELHMLLPTHAVSLSGLVGQQGLVLDVQPTHLPQRLTSFPRNTASQSEGLLHWSFQALWCCYPAWNIHQYIKTPIINWCDVSSRV